MYNPFGHGIAEFFESLLSGLVEFVLVVAALTVAFLFARFLLVATKAAQHYLDKNGVVTPKRVKTVAPSELYNPGPAAPAATVPATAAPGLYNPGPAVPPAQSAAPEHVTTAEPAADTSSIIPPTDDTVTASPSTPFAMPPAAKVPPVKKAPPVRKVPPVRKAPPVNKASKPRVTPPANPMTSATSPSSPAAPETPSAPKAPAAPKSGVKPPTKPRTPKAPPAPPIE